MILRKADAQKKIIVDEKTGRVRVQTINPLPTKTQQQYKDACDLNKILSHAKRTGELPFQRSARGYYMDTTVLPQDYQAALDLVIDGTNAFNNLSSEMRKRFDNDPKKLLEFLQDPKNHEEAIALELKKQQDVENVNMAKSASATKGQKNKKNDDNKSSDDE